MFRKVSAVDVFFFFFADIASNIAVVVFSWRGNSHGYKVYQYDI
jgi:hypothetical protein